MLHIKANVTSALQARLQPKQQRLLHALWHCFTLLCENVPERMQ